MNKEVKYIQIDRESGEVIEIPAGEEYALNKNHKTVGVVVPRKNQTSVKYLNNSREYAVDHDVDIHDIIRLCNVMYYREGTIGGAIDLFVDYGITELEVAGLDDGKEKDTLNWWLQNLNRDNDNMEPGIRGLLSEVFLDYWIAGNVFLYKKFENVKSVDISSKTMRGKTVSLPMHTFLLDPLFIYIPEYLTIAGGRKEYRMKLEPETLQLIQVDKNLQKEVFRGLSDEDRNKILRTGELPLSAENIIHVKRKGRGYQVWGVPYLMKAFGAMARKKKLQALDEATVDGLINQIVIFKIGEDGKTDPEKLTWDPSRLQGFARLLKHPNPSNFLIWTSDIETEIVAPNDSVLGLDNKYVQADKEILKALGIPTVLLAGEGSTADNTENVWVAISSLMEKIEGARRHIKICIENLMLEILEMNGMDTKVKPKLRWRKPNLRNTKEFMDFYMTLYDRGILPREDLAWETGQDFGEITRKRVQESKNKIDGKSQDEIFMPRDIPYSTPVDKIRNMNQDVNKKKVEKKTSNPPTTPATPKKTKASDILKKSISFYEEGNSEKALLQLVGAFEHLKTAAAGYAKANEESASKYNDKLNNMMKKYVNLLESENSDFSKLNKELNLFFKSLEV